MSIRAIASEAIPKNRLLCLTKTGVPDNEIHLRLAKAKERPDFFTRKELAKDDEVGISIQGNPVWQAEAAEDIPAGISLSTADGGKVAKMVAGDTNTESYIGYSLHAAKEGEVVKFVRNYKVSNEWIDHVNTSIGGGGTT